MNKYIVICIIVSLLLSCKKSKQDAIDDQTQISLTIESTSGIDLLNPSTPSAIKEESIQIFYDNDGKRETYASTSNAYMLDNPKGFTLNMPVNTFGGKYFLYVYSNGKVSNHTTTIIAIRGMDEIKLVTEVLKINGSLKISKIWYKETLVWPVEGNDGPKYVRIILEQ